MKRPVLRLACALAVLALLACGAYALTSGDSLISLSYLKNTFLPQAVSQGGQAAEEKLQQTYDGAKSTLDQLQKGYLAQITGEEGSVLYSGTLQPRDWNEGDEVELTTGSGVLMLEGAASVTHDGAFIDVTAGAEVPSEGQLTANHRYLAGEDTLARITVLSGAARLGVQGAYDYTDGGVKATPFYDVCRTDWFYGPVNYAYQNQLFSGVDAHHFGPATAMDRAMLMTVLYRLAGAPEEEMAAADVSFADVSGSAWYAPYVKWGAAQGITAGIGPDRFGPEQKVTREQIVVLLYRFGTHYLGLTLEQRADLSGYQDLAQASEWAQDALSWAVAAGIISSSSADALILNPQRSASRAEVATMLRAFGEKIL